MVTARWCTSVTSQLKIVRLYESVALTTRSSADADNRLDVFSGQWRSRSTNMLPFHMLHIVSYCAIVTLSFKTRRFYDIRLQKIS